MVYMIMSFVTHQWFLELRNNQQPSRFVDTQKPVIISGYIRFKDGAQQFVARDVGDEVS